MRRHVVCSAVVVVRVHVLTPGTVGMVRLVLVDAATALNGRASGVVGVSGSGSIRTGTQTAFAIHCKLGAGRRFGSLLVLCTQPRPHRFLVTSIHWRTGFRTLCHGEVASLGAGVCLHVWVTGFHYGGYPPGSGLAVVVGTRIARGRQPVVPRGAAYSTMAFSISGFIVCVSCVAARASRRGGDRHANCPVPGLAPGRTGLAAPHWSLVLAAPHL